MQISALTVFALALAVAAASPGPTITTLVARVLVRGTTGALAFVSGLLLASCCGLRRPSSASPSLPGPSRSPSWR